MCAVWQIGSDWVSSSVTQSLLFNLVLQLRWKGIGVDAYIRSPRDCHNVCLSKQNDVPAMDLQRFCCLCHTRLRILFQTFCGLVSVAEQPRCGWYTSSTLLGVYFLVIFFFYLKGTQSLYCEIVQLYASVSSKWVPKKSHQRKQPDTLLLPLLIYNQNSAVSNVTLQCIKWSVFC